MLKRASGVDFVLRVTCRCNQEHKTQEILQFLQFEAIKRIRGRQISFARNDVKWALLTYVCCTLSLNCRHAPQLDFIINPVKLSSLIGPFLILLVLARNLDLYGLKAESYLALKKYPRFCKACIGLKIQTTFIGMPRR